MAYSNTPFDTTPASTQTLKQGHDQVNENAGLIKTQADTNTSRIGVNETDIAAIELKRDLAARIERDATLILDFANNRYRIHEGIAGGNNLKLFEQIVTHSRLSDATGFSGVGRLETVTDDVKRLVYSPETGKSEGLLVEGSATNSLLHNRNLADPVWGGSATVAKDAVGLDGVANTAWTVTDDSTISIKNSVQSLAIPDDSNANSVAFYLKKDSDESRFPLLALSMTGGTAVRQQVVFNTASGVITSRPNTDGSDKVEDEGAFWKVILTASNNSTGNTTINYNMLPAWNTDGTVTQEVTATGSIVYDYGQVILNSSTVGSPILTTTAAATRAADVVTQGEVGKWFTKSGGTLFYEGIIPRPYDGDQGTGSFMFQIYKSGSSGAGIGIGNNSSGRFFAQVAGFSGTGFDFAGVYGEKVKMALSFSQNTIHFSLNGSTNTLTGTLDILDLDSTVFSGLRDQPERTFDQIVGDVRFTSEIFTADELDAITGA